MEENQLSCVLCKDKIDVCVTVVVFLSFFSLVQTKERHF